MSTLKGFWSYVHEDDKAVSGRIANLARDLVNEYQMITGETIKLFLDKDFLEWGDDWQKKVDESLASVAFFIPVLTPRFFQSPECKRELNYFVRQAKKLGVTELIMPILYVDVPQLEDSNTKDDTVLLIKSLQREDWRELRLLSSESPEYLQAVARMARKLAEANTDAEKTDAVVKVEKNTGEEDDIEKPGTIDLLAKMETTMPEWTKTIEDISSEIEVIGALMEKGTAQINASDLKGGSLAGRLKVIKGIAKELTPPSLRVENLGQKYTAQLHNLDEGVRILIKQLPQEIKKDKKSAEVAEEALSSIHSMAKSNNKSVNALEGLLEAISPIEDMSRDMRKPLRTIRSGLTSLTEGSEIINEWVDMIDDLNIDLDYKKVRSRSILKVHPK